MSGNLDNDYQKKAMAYNLARSKGTFTYSTGHYQGTREAFKLGFADGATIGAGVGLVSSMYFRKFVLIPKWSLLTGVSYGTIMTISQLYRFDL